MESEQFEIKEYIFGSFKNDKYKHKSLIEIYLYDRMYYEQLRKRKMIHENAIYFFTECDSELQKTLLIPIEAVRKIKCEQIVDEFRDTVEEKNRRFCDERKEEKKEENVDEETSNSINKLQCCVCGISNVKKCRKCKKKTKDVKTSFETVNGKKADFGTKFCDNCQVYYINYNTFNAIRKESVNITNINEIDKIANQIKKKREKEELKLKQLLKKREKKNRQRENQYSKNASKYNKRGEEATHQFLMEEKKRLAREKLNKQQNQTTKVIANNLNNENNVSEIKDSSSKRKANNIIRINDFVVRRTTFKCIHNEHNLQNIDATISIFDKKNNEIKVKVSAGYCPECNIYFIMEDTYQNLKRRGVLMCRVTDEKTYMSNGSYVNGMRLASESILMQYGYNVSQTEGLSALQRRKILSLIVDNKILTRSDIISYLHYFINQRKNMRNMEKAIEKWESDIEFIENYKVGSYEQYGVKGINRKY